MKAAPNMKWESEGGASGGRISAVYERLALGLDFSRRQHGTLGEADQLLLLRSSLIRPSTMFVCLVLLAYSYCVIAQ